MSIDNYTGMDENDNTVSINKGICVIYEKTGNDPLFLETEKAVYNDEGADEDSENQVSSAVWVKDEVRYELISLYKATPADMLFEMAEELIKLP
ncbi:MAG: hypothetical protein HDQ97_01540 [Lachnospiraceae bacterium]|nr:hypothetical protein [Lachnospiraceae bacterium]